MNQATQEIHFSELLICPVCDHSLSRKDHIFLCTNEMCSKQFPIANGIPIIIDENNSIFNISNLLNQASINDTKKQSLKSKILKIFPSTSANIKGKSNYNKFIQLLDITVRRPKVLVIGGGVLGQGMEVLTENKFIDLIESDVYFGPRVKLIADAHKLPFPDESIDAIVIQAVLEHVLDPYQCTNEIYRVLKSDGIVYAETPFIQQVHAGAHDFTRFTHLGHRRLFRKFEEIESGASCGPGMALAWSYTYFLTSFTSNRILMKFFRLFASFTSFFLKYFDYILINKPGTLDAASGYYFLGKKSSKILSDKELLKLYGGTNK